MSVFLKRIHKAAKISVREQRGMFVKKAVKDISKSLET
jgi:hypothetical protein